VRILLQSLLLTAIAALTGCITAGGKPVGALSPTAAPGELGLELTAEEIAEQLRLAEKRREEVTKAGKVYVFDRDIVIENFDSKGKLERRQTRRFRSFTDNRVPVLVRYDGKEPTPKQIEKESKKILEHKLKFLGGGKEDEQDANLLVRQIEQYRDNFTPRLFGTGTVEGRPAYVLQFLLDEKNKLDDPLANIVLKNMELKLWIDREEFQIAKLEAELKNELYVVGGLAGKVHGFKLTAHQQRLTPDIWADWKVNFQIRGRILWETKSIKFRSESTGFKLLVEPIEPNESQ